MSRVRRAPASPSSRAVLSHWWLAACLAVYAALTGLLIFRVPLQAEPARATSGVQFLRTAPDEAAHFEYVAYLAEKGRLPIFKPLGANAPGYEFHQPPLYYALCALPWKLLGGGAAAQYFCRLLSLLCGAATLVLLWHSAAALFPERRFLPLLATGFAALWPLHINVGAAAGPDALTDFWCAAIFYLIARAARRRRAGQSWQLRDSLWMGGVLGLGLLTKNTPLALAPLAVIAAWIFAAPSTPAEETATQKEAPAGAISPFSASAAALAVALLLAGGWWARNTMLYGDPLAMQVFNRAFRGTSPGPETFLQAGVPLDAYLRAVLMVMFSTFWGIFGGPNTAVNVLNVFGARGPAPEAMLALPLILLCAAATLIASLGLARGTSGWKQLPVPTRMALWLWLGGGVLVLLAWLQFNLTYFQAQARYLHPAALPLALALAVGWQTLWNHAARRALWAAGGVLFAMGLLLLTLWNAFGWQTLV